MYWLVQFVPLPSVCLQAEGLRSASQWHVYLWDFKRARVEDLGFSLVQARDMGTERGKNTLKWTVRNSLLQQPEQQKQILFLIMFVQVNIKTGSYSQVLGQKQPGIQTLATNSPQAGWSTTIGMASWEGKHLSGLNEWWGPAPFLPLSLYSNVLLSRYLALCFLPHFSCSISDTPSIIPYVALCFLKSKDISEPLTSWNLLPHLPSLST